MKTVFRLWVVLFIPFLAYSQQITFNEYRRRADKCLEQGNYTCAGQNYERALRIRENDAHCINGLTKATQALNHPAKPKLPKPKPQKSSAPLIKNPSPAAPFVNAFLLVQTDLPVYIIINGGARYFVSPTDIAKKLPLDVGANIVSVKPADGGTDGYENTVTVNQSGNKLFKVKLLEERKAAQERQKPKPVQEETLRPTNAVVNNAPPKNELPAKKEETAVKEDLLAHEFSRLMVLVKGGNFQMGGEREKPIHPVMLHDFYISKYEVTQRQWRTVMGTLPKKLTNVGCNDCPVEQVSWNEVQEFLNKLTQRTGIKYRLPTEAEWEYAARGGQTKAGEGYTSGPVPLKDAGWYRANSSKKTHPVGQKMPNALGLYDMQGNVWEWCRDWFSTDYYSKSPVNNPVNLDEEKYRVIRGGSLDTDSEAASLTSRDGYKPDNNNGYVGFRLVRD